MNTQLPGNLEEIFPLRLRLREELLFYGTPGAMVVERVARQQRYSLKQWQYEMLARFDGRETFEQVAKRVYALQPGEFTALALLNFYHWLYDNDLILCECASIFELIGEAKEVEGNAPRSLSTFREKLLTNSRLVRGITIVAALVFSLSALRIVYVTAPIFGPSATRLYAKVEGFFGNKDKSISHRELARSAALSPVKKAEFASKVEVVPSGSAPDLVVPVNPPSRADH